MPGYWVSILQGHTHNGVDRRFASVGTALTTAKSLLDPDQFCQRIMDTVAPLEGHELVAQAQKE